MINHSKSDMLNQSKNQPTNNQSQRLENLYQTIANYIRQARTNVVKNINTEMLNLYWITGRDIVIEEQQGKQRADYGSYIIKTLSTRLQAEFGHGFSEATLIQMRKFFLIYQEDTIPYTMCTELKPTAFMPNLGWSHYRILMRISDSQARSFYEIEANKNQWPSRTLRRQVNSLLYERLAMSKDKEGLLRLAQEGQVIEQPADAIKDPVVLEFLDIPPSHQLTENKLESALITHMQNFLLELGAGFAFVGRQKPIILNGCYYYPDLVFYHTILKCYLIADIKVDKVTHGDLGQMQFYVNYYDKECKAADDNPTVGLILCTEKDDALVKYTLDEKTKQIFASKYQFQLPSEEELKEALQKERALIEHQLAEEQEQ